MTKLILLREWAKKNKIPFQQAKDMARRGKLRDVAIKKECKVIRWMVPEDHKL